MAANDGPGLVKVALSPEGLARRRSVWLALSGLFLDTETRWSIPGAALILAESGYCEAELERIWSREAVPEWGRNLMRVAGEWGAFRLDEASLLRRAEGSFPTSARLTVWIFGRRHCQRRS